MAKTDKPKARAGWKPSFTKLTNQGRRAEDRASRAPLPVWREAALRGDVAAEVSKVVPSPAPVVPVVKVPPVPVVPPVATPKRRAPGAGRKPGGVDGRRVRDYPPVMLRLPVDTLARLKALAAVQGVPVWKVVETAVLAVIDAQTGADAATARRLAKREAERLRVKHPKG